MEEMMSERALARMIEAVNKHLPRQSKSLAELLQEEYPTIRARDGNEYLIERKELEFIAQHVDRDEWDKFSIPIILEMCNISGNVLVYVRNKRHAAFLKKAFGYDRFVDDVLVIYPYEMRPVRRKLKTASQVMFNVLSPSIPDEI
ncbi:DUF61 family protein [Archaeoglobus veneficus]|uniref:UPF0216 protein Arcve_1626 n=1 Tax=Archaeoglobus veneficus (strain DSM 11195 / SNP6) TaxID=693661 RepID=F2KQ23_ARCVS|nr:DUF61 family protein [Archaeoglobus veneficus]AEA47626.1 protein of unknown function DUF61 [Archaeoglobus veneficus SNP6]